MPTQRAFYYVPRHRDPTPRWTAYDAKYFGITMPRKSRMTTTERAYTSPIWYTPGTVNGQQRFECRHNAMRTRPLVKQSPR